jgi:hypothetical protein
MTHDPFLFHTLKVVVHYDMPTHFFKKHDSYRLKI